MNFRTDLSILLLCKDLNSIFQTGQFQMDVLERKLSCVSKRGNGFTCKRLCCTNRLRDSLFESSVIAGCHEQLVTYEVQDQELAFVQHGAEAARFSCNLV